MTFKKHIIRYSFLVWIIGTFSAKAQVNLTQTARIGTANLPSHFLNVHIQNTTSNPIRLILNTEIKKGGRTVLKYRSNIINILGRSDKQIHSFNVNEVQPLIYDVVDPAFRGVASDGASMPAGVYQICIRAQNADNQTVYGQPLCYIRQVQQISPPQLILPMDKQVLTIDYPVFSWVPPQPLPSGKVYYRLNLVEVSQGKYPEQAVQYGFPILSQELINITSYQYPITATSLEPCKTYAWQVIASRESINRVGENSTVKNTDILGASNVYIFNTSCISRKSQSTKLLIDKHLYMVPQVELDQFTYQIPLKDSIRFKYEEKHKNDQISYEVYNWKDKSQGVLPVRYGVNYCSISIDDLKLSKGEYYVLEIENVKGNKLKARFKYEK